MFVFGYTTMSFWVQCNFMSTKTRQRWRKVWDHLTSTKTTKIETIKNPLKLKQTATAWYSFSPLLLNNLLWWFKINLWNKWKHQWNLWYFTEKDIFWQQRSVSALRVSLLQHQVGSFTVFQKCIRKVTWRWKDISTLSFLCEATGNICQNVDCRAGLQKNCNLTVDW